MNIRPMLVRACHQAFITSRLDWCNSLYYGITDEMRRLQSEHNAAARLITGTRRCDHISPVLRQLHWLPARQLQDRHACSSVSVRTRPNLPG